MMNMEKRLLLIDPDAGARLATASFLRRQKYSVETGKNLTEALKKLASGTFRCLLLDVDIPEMKGYEAVRILKNMDPTIKVIMMTQKNTKKLEAKVREQDIFFYFIKSFGKEELKLAVNNVFST